MQLLATFTYGDTGRDLNLTLTDDQRTALNLTGATAITLTGVARRASGDATLSVTGSLVVAASGTILFAAPGNAAAQPEGVRGADHYTCQVSYTLAAEVIKSDLFLIRVQRFPS